MNKTNQQIEIEMGRIKTKEQVQTEQQFLYIFSQIIEAFPQYSLAQHLVHFTRKKADSKDTYEWSDEKTLRRIEDYYDELMEDLSKTTE